MRRQILMGQVRYLAIGEHCLCEYPFGLRGQLRVYGLPHWIEYCPGCQQTYVIGDGIPPKGTPLLDPNDEP